MIGERSDMIRRTFGLLLVVLSAVMWSASPVSAYPWNYVGSSNICGTVACGSGGALFYRDGHYFFMSVGHTVDAPSTDTYQYHPDYGYLGKVAYKSPSYEMGLIDLGTSPLYPLLRVTSDSSGVTVDGIHINQIATVGQYGDAAVGSKVCYAGWSAWSQQLNNFRCGQAGSISANDQNIDTIDGYNIIDNGDSGGPVWQPLVGGKVRLVGFISKCWNTVPCTHGAFTRVANFQTHSWTSTGDQVGAGFSSAPGGWVVTG